MKKIYKYIIVILLIISCSSDKSELKLIGKWKYDSSSTGQIVMEFFKDSLIVNDDRGKSFSEWKATEKKIFLKNIKGSINKNKLTYKYKLFNNEQSLTIEIEGDSIFKFQNFVKIESKK